MENSLEIIYRYTFQDGKELEFPLLLEKKTLSFRDTPSGEPPFWAELPFNRCTVCSIDPDNCSCCPIAVNLSHIVEAFKDFFAYETVQVVVTTRERTYSKSAT